MRRGVEEAVIVRGLVENAYISFIGRLPFNEGKQATGVAFKRTAIVVDAGPEDYILKNSNFS